jgi:hypothetical protein
MTANRFDRALAALARAPLRRDVLAALVAAITARTAARDPAQAANITAMICLGRDERCKRKRECCAGRCRRRKGKKKRKCACSPRGARCLNSDDCCERGAALICASGFCVPDR